MSFVLGVLQGLSEFLPISSSGHLQVLRRLFGVGGEAQLSYDVFLHAGTFLATVVVFRERLVEWGRSIFQARKKPALEETKQNLKYLVLVLVGSLPTLVLGLGFRGVLEQRFNSMVLVGVGYAITTGFLFATLAVRQSRATKTVKACSYGFAIVVGLSQGLALLPGASRSGITIATALLLGIERRFAGEFSFMLSLPTIAGAIVLEGVGVVAEAGHQGAAAVPIADYVVGFLTSFAVGFLALLFLMKVLRSGKMYVFGAYTFAMMGLCWLLASTQ